MIRRDFDLEEMKYFLHLVGQSTDDYLYILDLTNDKAVYSKSITNVFALDSEEFSNATQELVKVVHPDDIDMLMNDIQDGMNGRKSSHNLEYRWKTVDGEYVAINSLNEYSNGEKKLNPSIVRSLMRDKREYVDVVSVDQNIVSKHEYKDFEKTISKLAEFLRIFKADLKGIEIDKKENHDVWICDLVMNYETYNIHAEYESTGIKKLIQLFVYLREMVKGGIVFIDEFDSNLHDVYLCALLEYLAEYGEGQLCFTTHNVGPMDILKQYNKSIDFLSEDHKIYPWTKRGNYSPSKLYRNGMIEGNPFNIDSIDFIGVFGFDEEDE